MSGWVAFFIVVAAIAIILQMAILGAMYFQIRVAVTKLTRVVTDLQASVDPILVRVKSILDNSEDRIASIMGDAAELTMLARSQAQKVDRVFTDAVDRLRVQIVRADHILTGTLEVIEEAGSTLRTKVWQPLHQASAIMKGIKAGLDFMRGDNKRRAQSDPTTQDEELFI